jgi:hypothetical protein
MGRGARRPWPNWALALLEDGTTAMVATQKQIDQAYQGLARGDVQAAKDCLYVARREVTTHYIQLIEARQQKGESNESRT